MGGTDDPSNLVKLTIEEHAEAHKKLWETHGLWQDNIAWKALSGQITHYEATIQAIKITKTGSKHTDHQKKLWSENRLGSKNAFYGRKHSDETISKMRNAKLGKKQTEEQKQKYKRSGELNSFYGKHHSEEFCNSQRLNRLGKKDSPETREKKRIAQLKRYNKIHQESNSNGLT